MSAVVTCSAREDVIVLKLMIKLAKRREEQGYSDRHAYLADKIAMKRRIAACAENGKVAVVESGMDCDCVRYSGHVSIIDATVEAYEAHYDHVAKWADGPFSLGVVSPSEARKIKRQSRDLALEAFEDGHAHVVYA